MNLTRRKALEGIRSKIEDIKSDLETLLDEEQDYFDNMPESLQTSERGLTAENAVSGMTDAIDNLDQAGSSVDNCCSQ